ncbi:unnamed protein product [Blepharisma stoltei]|uniref:Uncharacterized protein n=1 Tax=Blepharisma stoltei TaxID=1481888 RepID=A0AAU9JI05_9CILI|nr:unnamed protein product [Blepharisma stoltei]
MSTQRLESWRKQRRKIAKSILIEERFQSLSNYKSYSFSDISKLNLKEKAIPNGNAKSTLASIVLTSLQKSLDKESEKWSSPYLDGFVQNKSPKLGSRKESLELLGQKLAVKHRRSIIKTFDQSRKVSHYIILSQDRNL